MPRGGGVRTKARLVSLLMLGLGATAGPLSAQTLPGTLDPVCDGLGFDPLGGCVAWEQRYDGPSPGDDGPADLALSPDGARLFVTGFTYTRPPSTLSYGYVTLAYDAATGAPIWSTEYHGPGADGAPAAGDDFGMAVVVSPDGGTVYVTGTSFGFVAGPDVGASGVATVAYDAATGVPRWAARYHGAALATDVGRDVATSPDGAKLYVVATLGGADQDVALLTFDAADGSLLHAEVYDGPGSGHDSVFFRSLGVAPSGVVYVGAQSHGGPPTGFDYALLRYDGDGVLQGTSRYDGGEGNVDRAYGLALAPDGSQVYVTGRSRLAASGYDYATVAFGPDGAQRWAARYDADGRFDEAFMVQASPDGSFVAVTGTSESGATSFDYATVAYDAATGAERWTARHGGPGPTIDGATTLAIAPSGGTVHATGYSMSAAGDFDLVTVHYEPVTGTALGAHTYLTAAAGDDIGRAVAVAPGGGRIYVTGDSHTSAATSFDVATLALDRLPGLPLPPLPLP